MAEVLHKKRGGNRKPLKPKNPSGNETNILPSSMIADSGKENRGGLSLLLSSPKRNDPKQAFAEELQELQGKIQQMQLEKEKTEELLNKRDEMLRRKEEEIQNWGKEQEKLKLELKRVQKMKEFQPTMVGYRCLHQLLFGPHLFSCKIFPVRPDLFLVFVLNAESSFCSVPGRKRRKQRQEEEEGLFRNEEAVPTIHFMVQRSME